MSTTAKRSTVARGAKNALRRHNNHEFTLLGQLTIADISLLGLGLCRLEEAADDYLDSNGKDEDDTFPCGPTEEDAGRNRGTVRMARRRMGKLKGALIKLHAEMLRRSAHRCIDAPAPEFSLIVEEFLEGAKR